MVAGVNLPNDSSSTHFLLYIFRNTLFKFVMDFNVQDDLFEVPISPFDFGNWVYEKLKMFVVWLLELQIIHLAL